MHISFEYPFFFLLTPLFFCFYRCKRENLKIYFSKSAFLPKINLFKKDLIPKILFFLFIISLSSPFFYDSLLLSNKKGRDLVLAIDASGSMGFGMGEKSKFDILLNLSKEFLKNRYDDNVGVVVFGSFAYPASPITYDLKALEFIFNYLDVSIAGNSTAIGDAIDTSIDLFKSSNAKEKVIILFTDGYHNSGKISPKDAVSRAKKEGVKIYTVGIGADFDKKLLNKISTETGAKSFKAQNREELKAIFDELNSLERSLLRDKIYENKRNISSIFIVAILILLAIEIRNRV